MEKIKELVTSCSAEELRSIDKMVSDRLRKIDANYCQLNEELRRQQRREERFDVSFLGTLTRLTDVKPGERRDYSVTIKDMSRSGMRLWIDSKFVPSRVVEVTFSAHGGKLKKCQLEVVRMRRKSTGDGSWLELGCQIIDKEELRRLRLQDERLAKVRSKVHNCGKVTVLAIGRRQELLKRLFSTQAGRRRYTVHFVDGVRQALEATKKIQAQLAVFYEEEQAYKDQVFWSYLNSKPADLATLAIIDQEEMRGTLLQAGVDECLSAGDCEDFLFRAIERALLSRAVWICGSKELSGHMLIVSVHNARTNLISFHLEDHGYDACITSDLEEAKSFSNKSFDAVFADFYPNAVDEFEDLLKIFDYLPVVAICDDISYGQQAIRHGASNYLCMPLNKEDIRMIIKQLISAVRPANQVT